MVVVIYYRWGIIGESRLSWSECFTSEAIGVAVVVSSLKRAFMERGPSIGSTSSISSRDIPSRRFPRVYRVRQPVKLGEDVHQ